MKETKSYCVTNFGNYAEGFGTLRASGGDIGGGSEVLVLQRRFSDVRVYDTEICTSLESGGGEGGNNLPMIVEVLPFDTTQITSDKNWSHPKYGDPCHPLASGQHPPHGGDI